MTRDQAAAIFLQADLDREQNHGQDHEDTVYYLGVVTDRLGYPESDVAALAAGLVMYRTVQEWELVLREIVAHGSAWEKRKAAEALGLPK